jgi:hypothetical protein
MPLATTIVVSLALITGIAGRASAEDGPVLKERTLFATPQLRVAFPSASMAAAQNPPAVTTATHGTNNHQFGAGLRLSAAHAGVGVGARYFFYGGPLGVQAELSRFGVNFQNNNDFNSVRFSPSVIYRFIEQKFNGPVSLTPYAGGGLSFVHSKFDEVMFGTGFNDTSAGVLLFGGVELFFSNVPRLGVSGELTYTSNDDVSTPFLGSASIGGATFTAAGHWYFW